MEGAHPSANFPLGSFFWVCSSSLKWHKLKKIYALKGQCQKQVNALGCLEKNK